LLEPCRQRIAHHGDRLQYLGGELPLPPDLAARATDLARRAIAALPCWLGYLGIDLVLGPQAGGAGDVVIEVNPRLTTSYIGLRLAARTNLAEAMLTIAEGTSCRAEFSTEEVHFSAAGSAWRGGRSAREPQEAAR
jgi:hypothetical protein